MEFAVKHDDGRNPEELAEAEVVLIGVSRTSKTPLSMYLAFKGYPRGQHPARPGHRRRPSELFEVDPRRGLRARDRRRACCSRSGRSACASSARTSRATRSARRSSAELEEARALMRRIGCIVVRTDNRAIEETAQEILRHLDGAGSTTAGLSACDRGLRSRSAVTSVRYRCSYGSGVARTVKERELSDVKRVYAFGRDGRHTEGNKDMKFILGGKGANLAEMANMGLPVPPGFTITCQACMEYYNSNAARASRQGSPRRSPQHVAELEAQDGQEARRRRRPAARLGALRLAVLDAGHDGHRPQPRPERRLGPGAHRARPATSASRGTATAASSRCSRRSCSTSRATCSRTRSPR